MAKEIEEAKTKMRPIPKYKVILKGQMGRKKNEFHVYKYVHMLNC